MSERIVMGGPLSPTASFRLAVDGPWTVKEIERLISVLNLVADYLNADEKPGQE